jgi:hypothetical protein
MTLDQNQPTVVVDTKPLWKSLTVWGVVVSLAAAAFGRMGFDPVDPDTQDETAQTIVMLIEFFVGPLMVLVGRWKARKPLSTTGGPKRVALLIPLVFVVTGCASKMELKAQRDNIYRGTSTIREQHYEWAHAIAGEEGYELPDLSPMTPEQRRSWLQETVRPHEEFDRWYSEGVAQDAAPLLPLGGSSRDTERAGVRSRRGDGESRHGQQSSTRGR